MLRSSGPERAQSGSREACPSGHPVWIMFLVFALEPPPRVHRTRGPLPLTKGVRGPRTRGLRGRPLDHINAFFWLPYKSMT